MVQVKPSIHNHKPYWLSWMVIRRDIPISVSLYSTPTGTAYIERLVESKKSTRTAKKGDTVLSKVSFNIYDMRTDHFNAKNTLGCLYMPYFSKENTIKLKVEINKVNIFCFNVV